METKYCPLLLAAGLQDPRCGEERCAWYSEDECGCALAVLAEKSKEEK